MADDNDPVIVRSNHTVAQRYQAWRSRDTTQADPAKVLEARRAFVESLPSLGDDFIKAFRQGELYIDLPDGTKKVVPFPNDANKLVEDAIQKKVNAENAPLLKDQEVQSAKLGTELKGKDVDLRQKEIELRQEDIALREKEIALRARETELREYEARMKAVELKYKDGREAAGLRKDNAAAVGTELDNIGKQQGIELMNGIMKKSEGGKLPDNKNVATSAAHRAFEKYGF
jgi:hypothetical protein